jgi:hypothetical protein
MIRNHIDFCIGNKELKEGTAVNYRSFVKGLTGEVLMAQKV